MNIKCIQNFKFRISQNDVNLLFVETVCTKWSLHSDGGFE